MKIALGLIALAIVAAACSQAGTSPAPLTVPTKAGPAASPIISMPAMSSATAESASADRAATAPPDATAVTVLDFKILPAALSVKRTFSLFVTNQGPTVHNVTIRDQVGKVLLATPDLRAGESAVLSGTLPAGTYVTFCSLPGHESLGTKGVLTIAP